MGKSFSHWIDFKNIPDKQNRYKEHTGYSNKKGIHKFDDGYEMKSSGACSVSKCFEMAEYRCCYKYVTGRAGRVSYADRYYCKNHAENFAEKNRIDLPIQNS